MLLGSLISIGLNIPKYYIEQFNNKCFLKQVEDRNNFNN